MLNEEYRAIIGKYETHSGFMSSGYQPHLKKLADIKAVVFDIYGTLLLPEKKMVVSDTELIIKIDRFCIEYGLQFTGESLLKAYRNEISQSNKLSRTCSPNPEVNILKIWQHMTGNKDRNFFKKTALEFEMIKNPVFPSIDLNRLFQYLKDQQIKIGILSNAQFYTEIILEYYLGRTLEEAGVERSGVLYSYRYKTSKPSWKLFERVFNKFSKFGIKKENILYCGNDIADDIIPAKRAGFKTAYFSKENWDGLVEGLADVIVTDLEQINQIV